MVIQTAYGKRTVVRRVGRQAEYVYTDPRPNAPNGEWWTLNQQRGWVDVPSNSRALQAAIAFSENAVWRNGHRVGA